MSEEFYIAAPVSLVTSDGGKRCCRQATSDETDLMEQAPALKERAEKAEAEIERLRGLVVVAFAEGLRYADKVPPGPVEDTWAWLSSDTKAALDAKGGER